MPPVPPEDVRVDVGVGADVNALAAFVADTRSFRFTSVVDRRALSTQSALDLDTALANGLLTGLWWVPTSSGASLPAARGHVGGGVGVVVDGVPLLGNDFGVSIAPTEILGLYSAATMTARLGPQSFTPSLSPLGGVIDVDTGGPMTRLGETMRVDGLVAAGSGGADGESGGGAVARTGWRTMRVMANGAFLVRADQRPGRLTLGLPPTQQSTDLLVGSGGSGGTLGARVDTAPLPQSRLFVSWLAGRSIDTPTPGRCGFVDEVGRAVDCVRARERGADVAIVGADIARDVGDGVTVVPTARVYLQRALMVEERSGRGVNSVDLAADEVFRGGVVLGASATSATPLFFDLRPRLEVMLDANADRASSTFASRSLRSQDGAPRGDGVVDDGRARSVDGATANTGALRARLQLQGELFGVEAATRLLGQSVNAPEVAASNNADSVPRGAVDTFDIAPSVDVTARLRLMQAAWIFVSAGSVQTALAPGVLVQGPGHGGSRVPLLPETRGAQGSHERFVETGISLQSAAVDVDAVGWAALRRGDIAAVASGTNTSTDDDGAVGLEGRITLKPAVEGLLVRGSLQGVAVDEGVFSDAQGPKSAVLQPLGRFEVHYAPTASMGVYGRLWGGLPQSRLSANEELDPGLCPERGNAAAPVADAICSGVAGFAIVDVGAFVRVGVLRIDLSGENLLDVQGAWRDATLGTGGAAVRARAAVHF